MKRNADGTVTLTAAEFGILDRMVGEWEECCEERDDCVSNAVVDAFVTNVVETACFTS